MQNNVEADTTTVSPEAAVATPKRLRPRWKRWLLWSAVRLLLLMGVGAGVETVQWRRTRPPDLMAHARRIASVAYVNGSNVNGYYWTPQGELRLYQHRGKGTASLRWNEATQSTVFVEMLKLPKGQSQSDVMYDLEPSVQWVSQAGKQFQIVYANRTWKSAARGKPLPKPDYTWKIRTLSPLKSDFFGAALSPDKKRVAYKCVVPREDWCDVIMQRFRRGYKPQFKGQSAVVLISAVDGKNTEVLGTVKDDMPAPRSQYSRTGTTYNLQGLFWCPDGKHLSFMYGDGVYEVTVK